jgi:hypothetical protein
MMFALSGAVCFFVALLVRCCVLSVLDAAKQVADFVTVKTGNTCPSQIFHIVGLLLFSSFHKLNGEHADEG